MFKFLHSADIHLDSPLLNLEQYDGAPVQMFREATRSAFDNLVELSIAEEVKFMLISGDLYDSDCRDSSTPLHFRRQMARLANEGIQVFIIQGNHDAGAKKAFSFELPSNVKLFSTVKPETYIIDELKVAIHGQGFATREIHEDLSANYPPAVPDHLNIGMLHTSCGHYEQHGTYAPSTIRDLTEKGYQYWALGHIHQRQVLTQGNCWIVYSGNPQGRHIREQGAKSCELVSVQHESVVHVQRQPIDVVRWESVNVDISKCELPEEILDVTELAIGHTISKADGRPMAIRLHFTGTTNAHRELSRMRDHWDRRLREWTVDHFEDQVWFEKIKFETTSRIALTELDDEDPRHQLVQLLFEANCIQSALADVRSDIDGMLKAIPTDPRLDHERIDLDDEQTVARFAADAKETLMSRLLQSGE